MCSRLDTTPLHAFITCFPPIFWSCDVYYLIRKTYFLLHFLYMGMASNFFLSVDYQPSSHKLTTVRLPTQHSKPTIKRKHTSWKKKAMEAQEKRETATSQLVAQVIRDNMSIKNISCFAGLLSLLFFQRSHKLASVCRPESRLNMHAYWLTCWLAGWPSWIILL